jgi:hypothetical protein
MAALDIDATVQHAAARILRSNWRGDHTVPAEGLYPHQWSWDSAFIAFGLRHLSPLRAQTELLSFFDAQWADGRLPQIVFKTGLEDAYFPGPEFWRSTTLPGAPSIPTAGLIQPPNHAWAAWAVHQADPELSRRTGFLERAYGPLERWHAYLRTRRNRGGTGLLAAVHPWETGMDNSPAWDEPLRHVPEHDAVPLHRPDLRHADAAERPTHREYAKYTYLANRYRSRACDDRDPDFPFMVEDPGMNALWAVSEWCLAGIARAIGEDSGRHHRHAAATAVALAVLYDAEMGLYRARDVSTGRLLAPTVAGLLPLLVPGLHTHAELLETLRGPRFRLGESALVPSYDLTQPDLDRRAYWRGPSWFNTAWMMRCALMRLGAHEEAEMLRATMARLALQHDFPEYVDPFTGSPHGTRLFSWTAALVLDAEATAEPMLP